MELIDIHTHILPQVDAGCASLEDACTMLRDAAQQGITDIVITCHYDHDGYFHRSPEYLRERFEEFRKVAEFYSLRLHLGNELYICEGLSELLKNGNCLSLAGSHYVLVEFPQTTYLGSYDAELKRLTDAGYHVIIAHPERYEYVQRKPMTCRKWTDKGYLLQCNAISLKKYPQVMKMLLQENLVSFIASDAHDLRRPLQLRDAYLEIADKYGQKQADALFYENPKKILQDKLWENGKHIGV